MTISEIVNQLNEAPNAKEEKILFLRRSRAQLLEEIHEKQQLLDQLDYMIHEMKEN